MVQMLPSNYFKQRKSDESRCHLKVWPANWETVLTNTYHISLSIIQSFDSLFFSRIAALFVGSLYDI